MRDESFYAVQDKRMIFIWWASWKLFQKEKNINLIFACISSFYKCHSSFTPQLVDRVFDESLNFRKIPPLVHSKPPEGNGRPNDARPQITDTLDPPKITRRRTWSRDEVSTQLDSLY